MRKEHRENLRRKYCKDNETLIDGKWNSCHKENRSQTASVQNKSYREKYMTITNNGQKGSGTTSDETTNLTETLKKSKNTQKPKFSLLGANKKEAAFDGGSNHKKANRQASGPDEEESIPRNTFRQDAGLDEKIGRKKKMSLEDEIQEKHKYFAYLLPMSADVLAGEYDEERFSEEKLMKKWRYSLELGELDTMLDELLSFFNDDGNGIEPGSLKAWMSFLEEKGIHEQAVQDNKLCVSVDNRAYYMNGYMFQDGVECEVEQTPWLFQDQVIMQGMIQEQPNDQEIVQEQMDHQEMVQEQANDQETIQEE